MGKFKDKLSALVETRKLIALFVVADFVYLSIIDRLAQDFIQQVIIAIVFFYFGQSTARDNPKKPEDRQ